MLYVCLLLNKVVHRRFSTRISFYLCTNYCLILIPQIHFFFVARCPQTVPSPTLTVESLAALRAARWVHVIFQMDSQIPPFLHLKIPKTLNRWALLCPGASGEDITSPIAFSHWQSQSCAKVLCQLLIFYPEGWSELTCWCMVRMAKAEGLLGWILCEATGVRFCTDSSSWASKCSSPTCLAKAEDKELMGVIFSPVP